MQLVVPSLQFGSCKKKACLQPCGKSPSVLYRVIHCGNLMKLDFNSSSSAHRQLIVLWGHCLADMIVWFASTQPQAFLIV